MLGDTLAAVADYLRSPDLRALLQANFALEHEIYRLANDDEQRQIAEEWRNDDPYILCVNQSPRSPAIACLAGAAKQVNTKLEGQLRRILDRRDKPTGGAP